MKPEMMLQVEFAKWLDSKGILHCASAGGCRMAMVTAINLKRAGYKKGYPDMGIFHKRGPYGGLFIELKMGSRITPEQIAWNKALTDEGYLAYIMPKNLEFNVAFKWLKDTVEQYMKLGNG